MATQTINQEKQINNKIGGSIRYTHTKKVNVDRNILGKNRLMAMLDNMPISDQYKILKTNILQKTRQEGLNTLLVTSAMEGEGKSITASNLAISLTKELQQTVLLVDADLRMPFLHKLFDLHYCAGLSDYLIDQKPLADLLITPGIDKLTLLVGHRALLDSTEIVGSTRMKELVQEVKNRYQDRYIIFDSPPLLGLADSLILSDYVDGIILVVEYGKTQQAQVEKALHLLEGKNLIGTVLNKAPKDWQRTYYSYSKL